MRLSIIVAMYNEVESVPLFLEQLREARELLKLRTDLEDIEVIVVDDGSTDGTAERVRQLGSDQPIRVVAHERNRGLGAALWTGLDESRGDVIVHVDADCTFRLTEIRELLAELEPGISIAAGSPYHPRGRVDAVPIWRLMLSRSLSRLYGVVLRNGLHSYTAIFRAYRRDAFTSVPRESSGFLSVTQMLIYPLLAGHRAKEYPTVLHGRRYGMSKMRVASVVLAHLGFLGRLVLHQMRLRRLNLGPDAAQRAK